MDKNLIISSEKTVALLNTDTMSTNSLFTTNESILRDVALHVSYSVFYVTDSADRIHRVSFDGSNSTRLSLSDDLKPWLVSIDWLNERLYVTGSRSEIVFWEIISYNLDGEDPKIVVNELSNQPLWMEIDPYNGYLFWVTNDGLYRVDLSNLFNSTVEIEVKLKLYRC